MSWSNIGLERAKVEGKLGTCHGVIIIGRMLTDNSYYLCMH